MSSFDLLSSKMKKKIWDMRWESFTPIQDQSIPIIIQTNQDVIISSGTASGKTEAAFLPILTLVEDTAPEQLKVLYVSPLKALINNQFDRIEKLSESTNIPIHRWHGDIDAGKKKKFVKNPSGILQITPESIESLFLNRTEYLTRLFRDLEFIVIDEIHAFIDNERGMQLRSLLSRLERYTNKRPRMIGLSATITNFDLVKEWVNHKAAENVKIINVPGSDKELHYHLMHFNTGEDKKKPIELYQDMRELTRESQSIIFCNSRGDVEETTVFLNRLAEREHMGETYFAHHSSIDKQEREFVEKTMSTSTTPKSVVATSSLELGINIGEIELVVQVDSTFTVSSLKQRLGRSGRKADANQYLQLYSTRTDSLVQSVAVMELLLDNWIEPASGYAAPYDILFHQILSICIETNGITEPQLIERVQNNAAFHTLDQDKISLIIKHMVNKDYLELIKGKQELIVGLEGERIVRSKDFYAVFMSTEDYEVVEGTRKIGVLDKNFPIDVGNNIILAGKMWTVVEINQKKSKIHVKKASNGKPPTYFGNGGKVHPRIIEKMFQILTSDQEIPYMNEAGTDTLNDARKKYLLAHLSATQRPVWVTRDYILLETYTGTTIANTLRWMLQTQGYNASKPDGVGRIEIKGTNDVISGLNSMKNKDWTSDELLAVTDESEGFISKFSPYLPQQIQQEMHVKHQIDIPGTIEYLKRYTFIVCNL